MTATATATEIDCSELKRALDSGQAVLLDVRAPEEHARLRIPRARLTPIDSLDPSALRNERRTIVVHCQAGMRGDEARARLAVAGIQAVNLKGGINAWKAAGLPVEQTRGVPISVLRQVQITAGSLVLIGLLLGILVWPWFLVLSAIIGAGLVFSGASGTCGMAALLRLMPWNRAFAAPTKNRAS